MIYIEWRNIRKTNGQKTTYEANNSNQKNLKMKRKCSDLPFEPWQYLVSLKKLHLHHNSNEDCPCTLARNELTINVVNENNKDVFATNYTDYTTLKSTRSFIDSISRETIIESTTER